MYNSIQYDRNNPLIVACMNDDLQEVRGLINRADVEMPDHNGVTLFMIACSRRSIKVIEYLIGLGVDINRKTVHGHTALVYACDPSIAKLLLEKGIVLDLTPDALRPLVGCRYYVRQFLFEYIMDLPCCPRGVKIMALEILGAAYVNEKEFYEGSCELWRRSPEECARLELKYRHRARRCWSRSLEERSKAEPCDQVEPKSQLIHPLYGSAKEFQTVEELDRIASSEEDMQMQALIIRERILGPQDPGTCSYIIFQASNYVTVGEFDRCIELVRHILKMPQEVFRHFDFCDIFHAFSYVMARSHDSLTVFKRCIEVVELVLDPQRDNINVYRSCPFLVTYIGHLFQLQSLMPEGDFEKIHESLFNLIKLNPLDDHRCRPLHDACGKSDRTFPLEEVVELLLRAGFHPQSVDHYRNTPMHYVAMRKHPRGQRVMEPLLSKCCGCAWNIKNYHEAGFNGYLPSKTVSYIEKPSDFSKLQCLSAKAVVNTKSHTNPFYLLD